MKILKTNILITTLAIFLCASFVVAAPGKPFSDEWVEGRIHGALAYNSYLDSTDLEVAMSKGIVTLTGTVSSDTERELAQQIAASVNGVTSVNNRIQVDPDLAPRSRPEWLQKFSDATTTAAVKSRLLANKNMHDMDIQISTKDGIVVLNGTVSSLLQKENAELTTLNTRGVQDVNNQLKIADPTTVAEKANNSSVAISRAVSDAWISSRIRSSLLFSSDFPGSSVRVSTNNGKVTLEGYTRNLEQSTEIERSINEFVGVREVDNNLKVRALSTTLLLDR